MLSSNPLHTTLKNSSVSVCSPSIYSKCMYVYINTKVNGKATRVPSRSVFGLRCLPVYHLRLRVRLCSPWRIHGRRIFSSNRFKCYSTRICCPRVELLSGWTSQPIGASSFVMCFPRVCHTSAKGVNPMQGIAGILSRTVCV